MYKFILFTEFPSQWLHRAIKYNSYESNTTHSQHKVQFSSRDYYHKLYLINNDLRNYKLVCYYTPSGEHDLREHNIDPFLCTHIIVGFARVVNNTLTLQQSLNEVIVCKISSIFNSD